MSTFVVFGFNQIGWTIVPSRALLHLHPTPIALDVPFWGVPLYCKLLHTGGPYSFVLEPPLGEEAQKVSGSPPLPVSDPHYPDLF